MIPPSEVVRLGRYLLFDRIASGGMAGVHLGRLVGEVGFARLVAIKRMHHHFAAMPELVAMFTDEARLAARVRHPNVVTTLDVVAGDDELFLVMEYVHGESLARLWRVATQSGEAVPLPIAVAIVTGALYGLHAAHEAKSERGEPLGLVHRDVSPQNILVDVDGVPRVLDFGVAKAEWRLQTTRQGQVKGKLTYMAPEQMSAQPVDRRADIYAASLVLWELLTGTRYVDTSDPVIAMKRILEGTPSPPGTLAAGIPPALDALVLRGLSRDPAARFATAKEMAAALEAVVAPATPREVGEWVQATARASLERRAELIAEIEAQDLSAIPAAESEKQATAPALATAASEAPTYIPTPAAPAQGAPIATAVLAPATPASEAPTYIPTPAPGFQAPAAAPTSAPSFQAPASAPTPAPGFQAPTSGPTLASALGPRTEILPLATPSTARPQRAGLLLACAAGAFLLLLGAGAIAVLGVGTDEAGTQPAPSATASPPAPASATAPPPDPAPAGSTPDAAPSASAAPAPPVSASAPAPSASPARPQQPPRPQPPRPSCDPPYFITKDGTKKYKLECL